MTTATVSLPRIGVPRLIGVELRKMVDTRAGLWLLVAIQLLAATAVVGLLVAGKQNEKDLADFLLVTLWVTTLLLPVLGILAVTSEWTQRTGLTTFALVPQRQRVIVAKFVAAASLTLVSVAVCLLLATVANVISGGSWALGLDGIGRGVLFALLTMSMGFGFGLTFMNSALAITLYFVAPTIVLVLGDAIDALAKPVQWLDMNRAGEPLLNSSAAMTGTDWAQIGTAAALWVGVFAVAGAVRLRQTELK
jgi:ABC-2 type transport system permease protein